MTIIIKGVELAGDWPIGILTVCCVRKFRRIGHSELGLNSGGENPFWEAQRVPKSRVYRLFSISRERVRGSERAQVTFDGLHWVQSNSLFGIEL